MLCFVDILKVAVAFFWGLPEGLKIASEYIFMYQLLPGDLLITQMEVT